MEIVSNFESSNVSEIRYESSTSTLEVVFHNGGTYQYFDVPDHIWEAFKAADSKGKFLAYSIKGHYRYAKI